MNDSLDLSIIVPCYNELESLPLLCEEIGKVIGEHRYRAEAVLVDDGSTDGTRDLYPGLCERYPWLRVELLKRNFGQTAAMMAGIRAARPQDADRPWLCAIAVTSADGAFVVAGAATGTVRLVTWRRGREVPLGESSAPTTSVELRLPR